MMEPVVTLLAILGAILAGAVSPGPSFILVCRIAVTGSRKAGLAAALGMGAGGAIFGGLALLGLGVLLKEVPSLHAAFKLLGGLYLCYLAFRIWRGAAAPLQTADGPRHGRRSDSTITAFAWALLTQLSNPKTAVVYGGIFAAFLPADPPFWLLAALVPGIFLVETSWYATVALLLSLQRQRDAYARSKFVIDRSVATVLGFLGARLVADRVMP